MLRRLIDIVLFSSLFISIGGSALVLRTYYLFGIEVDLVIVSLVFFSTLFTYNLTKLIPLWNTWKSSQNINYGYNNRNQWNLKHKQKLLYLTLFSLGVLVLISFQLNYLQILFLAHLGIVSLLYAAPVFYGKTLRSLPFLKIFLISYVWAAVSILPFMPSFSTQTLYLFVENFCFILAITIPFDIRDYSRDISQKITTIPFLIGVLSAKYVSILLLITSTIFSHFAIQNVDQEALNLIINVSIIPLLFYAKEKYGEYYYLGLLDGTLILKLVIIWI